MISCFVVCCLGNCKKSIDMWFKRFEQKKMVSSGRTELGIMSKKFPKRKWVSFATKCHEYWISNEKLFEENWKTHFEKQKTFDGDGKYFKILARHG